MQPMKRRNAAVPRPIHQSYPVPGPGRIYAGEYPGDRHPESAREKIAQALQFGVTHFIDLTEAGELVPYADLLPEGTVYRRFPVRDLGAPSSTKDVFALVESICRTAEEPGSMVYIHCWGGIGRTGTIVACLLAARMESPTLDSVLVTLREAASAMPKAAWRDMPESDAQYGFISRFIHDLPALREGSRVDFRDRSRGCLMAGAAGDALGYPVEFMSLSSIKRRYGGKGITSFRPEGGKALVSDDTQMTLFTANGILMGITRGATRGVGGYPPDYVGGAYLDWYYTQTGVKTDPLGNGFHYTWLRDLPQLAHQRAPGITCLSACESLLRREKVVNDSKGCGGIMRVAPMGLLEAGYFLKGLRCEPVQVLKEGGEIAAVTHKHPLAILPAALLAGLVYQAAIRTTEEASEGFADLVRECLALMEKAFDNPAYAPHVDTMVRLTEAALAFAADRSVPDGEAIRRLGEGWTGDEAWAVALFCAARHIDDPLQTLVSAVNHDGDSDSTGAIAGNIVGAVYGYGAIREKLSPLCPEGRTLEETLELSDLILTLADDLSTGCIISEYSELDTPGKRRWYNRYCEMIPDMQSIP